MAKVWVQTRTTKIVEERGKNVIYEPGEWVRVGKQLALKWIKQGDAWNFRLHSTAPPGCGIVAEGDVPPGDYIGLPISTDTSTLPWPKTLYWNAPRLHLRTNILPVGFKLLDSWQVVVPIWDYDNLACHTGSHEDRERTKAVVRDLRVPLYDNRMIFLRRCSDTQRLLTLWAKEREGGGDPKMALLRALYQVKPTICAQPSSWTQRV